MGKIVTKATSAIITAILVLSNLLVLGGEVIAYGGELEKQDAKTKLVNLVGNSDLVGMTNDDIKANDGWPLGWNVGDY